MTVPVKGQGSEEINVKVNDSLTIVCVPILNHRQPWLRKLIKQYPDDPDTKLILTREVLDGSLLKTRIPNINALGKAVMEYILNSEIGGLERSYPNIFKILLREVTWASEGREGSAPRRARWQFVPNRSGGTVVEGIRVNVERSLANDLLMQFRSIGAGAPPPVTDNMFQDWKHYIDRDFRIYAEEARSTPFGKSVSNGRAHRGCLTVMGIFLYCHMDETYLETIIMKTRQVK